MDLSDTKRLERELAGKTAFFERADAFVSLAADYRQCRFEDATGDDILATLSVNLLPGLLIMRTVGPAMAARGWGRIVIASSIGVKFGGGSESFLYSLSKHAGEFIPSAVRRWAEKGVLVNVLRVGVTNTRAHASFPAKMLSERVARIPAGRMASPAEIARTICWLGSDDNGYVSGQVIAAAGGE